MPRCCGQRQAGLCLTPKPPPAELSATWDNMPLQTSLGLHHDAACQATACRSNLAVQERFVCACACAAGHAGAHSQAQEKGRYKTDPESYLIEFASNCRAHAFSRAPGAGGGGGGAKPALEVPPTCWPALRAAFSARALASLHATRAQEGHSQHSLQPPVSSSRPRARPAAYNKRAAAAAAAGLEQDRLQGRAENAQWQLPGFPVEGLSGIPWRP